MKERMSCALEAFATHGTQSKNCPSGSKLEALVGECYKRVWDSLQNSAIPQRGWAVIMKVSRSMS